MPDNGHVDFNAALLNLDGSPMLEEHLPADMAARERAEELIAILQSVGRLTRDEAEELSTLKSTHERTLGRVCVNLLYGGYEGDKVDGSEKLKRHKLALQIDSDDDEVYPTVEISDAKKKILQELSGKYHSTLLHARVVEGLGIVVDDDDD
jgi:hypothetical protein